MNVLAVLIAASISLTSLDVRADVKPAPASRPATTQPAAVDLADRKALDAHVGALVAVEGTVSEAAWSSSGKVFLIKFAEATTSDFQGALFTKVRADMEKAFNGDLSKAFEGAKVRLTGPLQLYHEHPEIILSDPKQISITAKAPAQPADAATQTTK